MPSLDDRIAETIGVLRQSAELLDRLQSEEEQTVRCIERSADVTALSEEMIWQCRQTRARSRKVREAFLLVRDTVMKTAADIKRRRAAGQWNLDVFGSRRTSDRV